MSKPLSWSRTLRWEKLTDTRNEVPARNRDEALRQCAERIDAFIETAREHKLAVDIELTVTAAPTIEVRHLTQAEWGAEGRDRFGANMLEWWFICPMCKTVMTPRMYGDAGAPEGAVAFSCIGRYNESLGCNYTGGGLFRLNPVHVTCTDESIETVFEFAPASLVPES